ncbi:MAG: hypothetical protein H6736_01660 [Alphaproteobacteria bacterium]|nr:hypothetical protein [Alphaproteobacteria bacterium]MCB9690497.1 hypothetical protein [Alphaproteobacteria bacterium]
MPGPDPVPAAVLAIVRCPLCRGTLAVRTHSEAPAVRLACVACGREFPVVDGVPWLTPEDALKA